MTTDKGKTECVMNSVEQWKNNLELVKEYINKNNVMTPDMERKEYIQYVLNHIQKTTNDRCWLWNDVPHMILIENGIIKDLNEHRLERKKIAEGKKSPMITGLDILQITKDNKLIGIKCLHNNDTSESNLEEFKWMISNYNLSGAVYHASNNVTK